MVGVRRLQRLRLWPRRSPALGDGDRPVSRPLEYTFTVKRPRRLRQRVRGQHVPSRQRPRRHRQRLRQGRLLRAVGHLRPPVLRASNLDDHRRGREADAPAVRIREHRPGEPDVPVRASPRAPPPNPQDPNQGDGAGDADADYGGRSRAAQSVDGVADTGWERCAATSTSSRSSRRSYPNLKVLVSLGGWTYSKYFSDVARHRRVAQEVRRAPASTRGSRATCRHTSGAGGPGSGGRHLRRHRPRLGVARRRRRPPGQPLQPERQGQPDRCCWPSSARSWTR